MSQPLTEDHVRHVAKLSRLRLGDAEVAAYTHRLGAVLQYVSKLSELDVAGVEPMAHALDMSNVLRDDVPGVPLTAEQALLNAPDADFPFFKVPKVIGGASGA